MNKRKVWFVIAIVVQLALLAAVPAQKIHVRLFGKTVILKTAPVDPFDWMAGYHVTLSYEISTPRGVPGWDEAKDGDTVYVVLKEDTDGIWNAESVHTEWPEGIPPESVVIKGRKRYSRIIYGIESYYIPEGAREKLEADLQKHREDARIEVKVGSSGKAALMRLLVQDRVYDY
jgi:uncharacterized membrane-anchored protein